MLHPGPGDDRILFNLYEYKTLCKFRIIKSNVNVSLEDSLMGTRVFASRRFHLRAKGSDPAGAYLLKHHHNS